ncbi:mRNA surveillance protein pelota [Bacteroidota bacterium]
MKIIKKNLKKGEITLKIENLDDIWILSQIIEPEDFVKGRTERKIKIGDTADRNMKVVRKQFFLSVKVEKVEITDNAETLKVLGIITDGPDEIARGEHHSFNLETESVFTIEKTNWLNFQLQKIEEATKGAKINILIVIFDREEAFFAKLKGNGYTVLGKIAGDVQKKEEKHVSKDNFYKDIVSKITEYNDSGKIDNIIVASPGFWKESLLKVIPEELKKKVVPATVSQANERAISELLKRNELQKVLSDNRATQESKLVDQLLQGVSKDTATYGFKETKENITNGAVSDLLISNKFIQKIREEGKYPELENLMLSCEKMDGKIHIISSEEAEKSLDSLSGIAGILRWKS